MEDKNIFKKNFIWNLLGTSFNSFNSLFFLVIVTRINGLEDAGIFTLGFATATILFIVGLYAGRVYQVTESDKKIANKDFIVNRIISCVLMIVFAILFVTIQNYDAYIVAIFLVLILYRCIEAFSDVFYGILHKNELLHKVGKSLFVKSGLSIITFAIVNIITQNLVLSCLFIVFSNLVVMIVYDIPNAKKLIDKNEKVNRDNVIEIFKKGFFAFAIAFLALYLLNIPRYSIDSMLTQEMQAIFGIIVMPATVVALFGQFILFPYLNKISEICETKDLKKIRRMLL